MEIKKDHIEEILCLAHFDDKEQFLSHVRNNPDFAFYYIRRIYYIAVITKAIDDEKKASKELSK